MPDGLRDSEPRYKSLESGVMRKYHAPFGGRPTEKDYPVVPRRRPTLPNLQGWNRTPVETTSGTDAHRSQGFDFRPWYALPVGRCPMRVFKGMSGAPTSL
jgi:hypothetical protein